MNYKEQRLKSKMTQLDVAKEVGVTEQTYRLWERGAMHPNKENEAKLAVVFGNAPEDTRKPVSVPRYVKLC